MGEIYIKNIFLSKTTRLKALIFGLWHNLLDLYQVCSNYAPVAKCHRLGHMFYKGVCRDIIKTSSLKPQGREP